ncbi:MAG TPA: LppP/LprE family lipoprotein [Chloroflexota bacterium]|nr:LppP/LprE family lipoprotein [Chloroflexota bacterium]
MTSRWLLAPVLVLLALASGCGSPASTPAPKPTATRSSAVKPIAVDRAVIRRKGFVPDASYATTADGSGHTLIAWPAVCRGSADGHCQRVFFFAGDRFVGADTSGTTPSITNISAAGPRAFSITYAHYKPSDPLCCPSLPAVTITYRWNGTRMLASGRPPTTQ